MIESSYMALIEASRSVVDMVPVLLAAQKSKDSNARAAAVLMLSALDRIYMGSFLDANLAVINSADVDELEFVIASGRVTPTLWATIDVARESTGMSPVDYVVCKGNEWLCGWTHDERSGISLVCYLLEFQKFSIDLRCGLLDLLSRAVLLGANEGWLRRVPSLGPDSLDEFRKKTKSRAKWIKDLGKETRAIMAEALSALESIQRPNFISVTFKAAEGGTE